ncbi:hypothetical protein [Rhodococcus opacus]
MHPLRGDGLDVLPAGLRAVEEINSALYSELSASAIALSND